MTDPRSGNAEDGQIPLQEPLKEPVQELAQKPVQEPATLSAGHPSCPICGKAMMLAYRPFCSKHCADLDLSRWLNGVYAVPAAPDPEEADEMLAQLARELGLEDE